MQTRYINQTNDETAEIDVTPMLDVVFILLIFFIVTATFVKESGLDLNQANESLPKPVQDMEAIEVTVMADNSVAINQRTTDIRRVRSEITRLHLLRPDASVVIMPSPAAYVDTVVRVMDASREANVHAISIANTF